MTLPVVTKLVKCIRSPITFPLCIYTFLFLSIHVLEVPFVRLFEEVICGRYYGASGDGPVRLDQVDESHCKIAAVQERLTTLVSWKIFFDAIPGIAKSIELSH